ARSRAGRQRRQSIVLARRGRCIRRNREEVEGTTRWSGCSIRVAVWLLEIPPVWANSRCDLDAAAWASNGRGLVQLAGVDQAHEQVADAGPVLRLVEQGKQALFELDNGASGVPSNATDQAEDEDPGGRRAGRLPSRHRWPGAALPLPPLTLRADMPPLLRHIAPDRALRDQCLLQLFHLPIVLWRRRSGQERTLVLPGSCRGAQAAAGT